MSEASNPRAHQAFFDQRYDQQINNFWDELDISIRCFLRPLVWKAVPPKNLWKQIKTRAKRYNPDEYSGIMCQ